MNNQARQLALAHARSGDRDALGELLESYRPFARAILRVLVRQGIQGRVGQSDLIQDSVAEALRAFESFRGESVEEFTAWFRQIVVRSATRSVREHVGATRRAIEREQPIAGMSSVLPESGSSPSRRMMRQEEAARVAELVASLPEDMQAVLMGRHADDLPHAALAARLGRTEAAVRVLYVRALQRLRELLEQA